jgi:hypothetical protein
MEDEDEEGGELGRFGRIVCGRDEIAVTGGPRS